MKVYPWTETKDLEREITPTQTKWSFCELHNISSYSEQVETDGHQIHFYIYSCIRFKNTLHWKERKNGRPKMIILLRN